MNIWLGYAILALVSFGLAFYGARAGLMLGQLRLVLLVYLAPSPIIGVATNLAISTIGSIVGGINCLRLRMVVLRLLLTIGIPSMIGGILSFKLATLLNPLWVKLIIALVIAICGIEMIMRARRLRANEEKTQGQANVAIESILGVVLGAMSGTTGLLLGSIRLPIMMQALGVDAKKASATSMVIGALTGIAASIGATNLNKMNVTLLLVAVPPTVLGAFLGSCWIHKADTNKVLKYAGYIVTLSACMMFYEVMASFINI